MRNQYIKIISILILVIVFLYYINKQFNLESFQDAQLDDSNILYMLDADHIDKTKAVLKDINKYTTIKDLNLKVLKFNGVSSVMVLPKIDANTFTLSIIINTNSLKRQVIATSKTGKWTLDTHDGKFRFIIGDEIIVNPKPTLANTWYHLAISVSSSVVKLFVNGEEIKKNLLNNENTDNIILGLSKRKQYSFDGYIGEVKVFRNFLDKEHLCNLYMINGKTKFCKEPPKPQKQRIELVKCLYIPRGETEKDCVNTCNSFNNCNHQYCQTVCSKCIDREKCKWIPPPPPPPVPKKAPSHLAPYPPRIKVNAIKNKLLLEWVRPYDGGTPIINYLVMVQESFNKSDGVRLSLAPDPNCDACEYLIDGLKSQTFYDISVRAENNVGLGRISNIETVATKGELFNKHVSSALLESDNEIAEQAKKAVDYGSVKCSNKTGHILDRIGNRTLEDYINTLYKK